MSALFRRVRSTLTYSVAGSIGGGRCVPHAPAPTRYRFAIQGADNKAVVLKPNARLDAQWTASAWIRASPTNNAGGIKPANGHAGEDAIWKALWDIRRCAARLEKHAMYHTSLLKAVTKLVKAAKTPPSTWKLSNVLVGTAICTICYNSYQWLAQSGTVPKLEQYSVDLLNDIATDPQTKETIRMYLVMFADVIKRSFNPVGAIFSSEVEEQSFSMLVEKEATLAEKILLVIWLDDGATTDGLVRKLNALGSEDPTAVREVLILLLKSGYVVVEDQTKAITYWPSKKTIEEVDSGKLKSNVKMLIKDKVKADLKAKVKVPQDLEKDSSKV